MSKRINKYIVKKKKSCVYVLVIETLNFPPRRKPLLKSNKSQIWFQRFSINTKANKNGRMHYTLFSTLLFPLKNKFWVSFHISKDLYHFFSIHWTALSNQPTVKSFVNLLIINKVLLNNFFTYVIFLKCIIICRIILRKEIARTKGTYIWNSDRYAKLTVIDIFLIYTWAICESVSPSF